MTIMGWLDNGERGTRLCDMEICRVLAMAFGPQLVSGRHGLADIPYAIMSIAMQSMKGATMRAAVSLHKNGTYGIRMTFEVVYGTHEHENTRKSR